MLSLSRKRLAAGCQISEAEGRESREFKRFFEVPPARKAERVRCAFGFTDQVSASKESFQGGLMIREAFSVPFF